MISSPIDVPPRVSGVYNNPGGYIEYDLDSLEL